MLQDPLREASGEAIEVDSEELGIRQNLRNIPEFHRKLSQTDSKRVLEFLECPYRKTVLSHFREFTLEIVHRKSQSIEGVPGEDLLECTHTAFSVEIFINETTDVISCVIAEIIYGITLVRIHHQCVEIREVLLAEDIRKRLETV